MTHPAYVLILVTVLLAPEQLPTAQGAPGGNGVSPAARTSRLHSVSLRSAALREVDADPGRPRGNSFGRQGTTVTTTPAQKRKSKTNRIVAGALIGFGIGAVLGTTVGKEMCLGATVWRCVFLGGGTGAAIGIGIARR